MGEKCNANASEREAMMKLFPNDLSEPEALQAEDFCEKYLFYDRLSSRKRRFYCSSCRTLWTATRGEGENWWTDKTHNETGTCPACREGVTVKCLGRLGGGSGDYPSLAEFHNLVILRRAEDMALLVSAGILDVRYVPAVNDWPWPWEDSDTVFPLRTLTFYERRRYYMAQGKLAAWKRYCGPFYRPSPWQSLATAGEPTVKSSCTFPTLDNGAYYIIGGECLPETSMRYSAVERLYPPEFAEDHLYRGVVSYLAHYTRKPQLEMLVKLDHYDVVDELLETGGLHGLVNWRASNPPDFFRLSKPQYRAWCQAGGRWHQLRLFQAFPKSMKLEQIMGFSLVKSAPEKLPYIGRIVKRYKLPIGTALNYLGTGQRAQLWIDCVRMGEQLKLDFSRRDVLLPKDLGIRHDMAANTLEITENAEALEQYQTRKRELYRTYAMEAAGYFIRIPETAAEIVAEGRVLCHCVGGYAPRHMEGKVVILFLRSTEDPDTPLCTIEMNGTKLVQIHGYKNERDVGSISPMILYKDFLDIWLPWVEAYSPRDQQGRPVLPEKERSLTA